MNENFRERMRKAKAGSDLRERLSAPRSEGKEANECIDAAVTYAQEAIVARNAGDDAAHSAALEKMDAHLEAARDALARLATGARS